MKIGVYFLFRWVVVTIAHWNSSYESCAPIQGAEVDFIAPQAKHQ